MSTSLALLCLVLLYMVFVEPVVGKRMYQSLRTGRQTRRRFYLRTILLEWAFVLFVVALYVAGSIPLRLLGLYNPHGFILPPGIIGGLIVGMSGALVLILAFSVIRALRGRSRSQAPHDGMPPEQVQNRKPRQTTTHVRKVGEIDAMLPRTSQERWTFAGVALTAGICEEILFRGLPVYVLSHLDPNLGPILTILLTAIIFGFAHLYQGWSGVLGTGVLGAFFTAIFLSTGALWIPMALHFLIDLRAAFVPSVEET